MLTQIQNFKKFINYLNKNHIDYAVLGRKASLREIIDGDIDIVISYKNFEKIDNIILDFAQKNYMQLVQCLQHESTAKYFVLSDNKDHTIICPDICSSFVRDKRLLITNESLLKNRTELQIEGVTLSTLNPEYEFIYYFLKKIDKTNLEEREFEHLVEQFGYCNHNILSKVLEDEYFSKKNASLIITLLKNRNLNKLKKNILPLKKELHKRKLIKFSYAISDFRLKLKRILYKAGLSIAILGPDGSGKSTVIDGFSQNVKNGFRTLQYYHLFPKKVSGENTPNTNPQGEKPYSYLISQLKLIYLILVYVFGYFKVYLKLIRANFVVFDRYFDDIFIDRLRFRYKGFRICLKIASFFIPKPELYIYLDAPSEVIFSRKEELTLNEISRQRKEYLSLIKTKKNGYILNVNQTPEQVIFEAESIVLNYLELRQRRRI